MSAKTLIEGVSINLGGNALIVPPLNFKALKSLGNKIAILDKITGYPTDDQMDAVIEIVHSAVIRNYPETTKDDVESWIDLSNLENVLASVMGVSGYVKRPNGQPAGEGQASQ